MAVVDDCLFCRIISGDLPADPVFENEHVVVIKDINPQAPTHYLVLPREHVATLNDALPEQVGQLFEAAQYLAKKEGLAGPGYRTVINVNDQGGQTVGHLHLHLLGGRNMDWPPG